MQLFLSNMTGSILVKFTLQEITSHVITVNVNLWRQPIVTELPQNQNMNIYDISRLALR